MLEVVSAAMATEQVGLSKVRMEIARSTVATKEQYLGKKLHITVSMAPSVWKEAPVNIGFKPVLDLSSASGHCGLSHD